jgi:undecaprenol kinase/diacylglycerol kinase (ATP)
MRRFLTAVGFAVEGIVHGVRTQRHLRFHCCAALLALLLGVYCQLSALQWGLLTLTIAAVIAAELFNTAIESVVDLVSPEWQPLAKAAKDTAAGAVLVIAGAALIIGALLFAPAFFN